MISFTAAFTSIYLSNDTAEKSPQIAEILQIAQSKIVNRCSLYKPWRQLKTPNPKRVQFIIIHLT